MLMIVGFVLRTTKEFLEKYQCFTNFEGVAKVEHIK